MSLINQMLQDIERRESKPIGPPQTPGGQHYSTGSGAASRAVHRGWSGFLALATLAALAGGTTAWWLQATPAATAMPAVAAAAVSPAQRSAQPVETALPQSVMAARPPPAEVAQARLVPAAPTQAPSARTGAASLAQARSPSPTAQAARRTPVASSPETASIRDPSNAAAAAVRAAPTATARAEQLYQRALTEGKQSQPELALKSLREALDTQPGHVQARMALARVLVDKKQGEAAADLLADGLMLLPQQFGFALALAPLWIQSGRQDDAMGLLAQSAKSAGDAPDYHAYYASQLLQRKRHAEAARHYSIALRSSPGTVDWLIGLGLSVQGTGNDKEALETFRQAVNTGSLAGKKRELVEQMIVGLKTRLGL